MWEPGRVELRLSALAVYAWVELLNTLNLGLRMNGRTEEAGIYYFRSYGEKKAVLTIQIVYMMIHPVRARG